MRSQTTRFQEHGSDTLQSGQQQQNNDIQDNDPLLKNYSRYSVEFAKGNGMYLFDNTGKKYLDFLSGIAVTGFGHNHPQIKEAVEMQLQKLWHVSNLFQASDQTLLASKLTIHTGLDKVFFCNSGTEANEAAIKFARKWGGERTHIISMVGSFHGRTIGSMAATGQYKIWEGFGPMAPGFSYMEFGDADNLEFAINKNTVAIMLEPIQGESGIIVPPAGYLEKIKKVCDKYKLLLIVDEVQTGMGRTGKLFAYQWEDVKPDIISSAKGIANGLPLGAVICSKRVADAITPGCHGSTFGGNPVAIAAANKVVDLLDDDCLAHISDMGEELKNAIKALNSTKIKEVRGKGLMIGVELGNGFSAKKIAKELLEQGVVVGTSGDSVIRLLPPYIIDKDAIMNFTDKLDKVLAIQ